MTVEQSIQTAVHADNCVPATPETFMASILQPLDLFSQTIRDFNSLDEKTLGPQGLAVNAARKQCSFLLQMAGKNDVTGIINLYFGLVTNATGSGVIARRKAEERYVRENIKRTVQYVADGIETDNHPPYTKHDEFGSKTLTPEEKQTYAEILEEIRQVRIDYSKAHANLNHSWVEQGRKVTTALASYSGADFQKFVTLIKYLQETETDQVKTLARLIDYSEQVGQDPTRKVLESVRHQEEAQPTPATLLQFLTSIAGKYYQNGQKDELWAGISIFLDTPDEILRETFTNPNHNQQQKELLQRAIDSLINHGIPPMVAARYQSFLSEQQALGWHYIIQRGSALNEKNQYRTNNDYEPEAITWSQRKSRKLRGTDEGKNGTPNADINNNQDNEPKPPTRLIMFMLSGMHYITGSVEEIPEQLRKFFKDHQVRVFIDADIEAYTIGLAKKAGLRGNASGIKEEKMKGIPKVTFINRGQEEKVPFFILRRETSSAPRLGVAYPQGFIVLLTAWDRTDTSYRDQVTKYSFKPTSLPLLPQPAPAGTIDA